MSKVYDGLMMLGAIARTPEQSQAYYDAMTEWDGRKAPRSDDVERAATLAWNEAVEAAAVLFAPDLERAEKEIARHGGEEELSFDHWNNWHAVKGNADNAMKRIRALKRTT